MGITLEEIEINAALPINPTIIRIMRVLRITRGNKNYDKLSKEKNKLTFLIAASRCNSATTIFFLGREGKIKTYVRF